MSTLVAYASPLSALPDYADHTFVICSENGASFACWSGPAPMSASVKILEASYPNAYAVANGYRAPLPLNGHTYPDTAGVGLYGLHGVCHQSTNCFMYAATFAPMPLVLDANGGIRPMGLLLSYATYGFRGTRDYLWYPVWYLPNRNNQDPAFAVASLDTATRAQASPEQVREQIVGEFAQLVRQACVFPADAPAAALASADADEAPPALDVDPTGFAGLHRDYLAETNALLAADVKEDATHIGERTAERVNDLGVEFLRGFEESVGAEAYSALTGLQPGERLRLVDPRIASGMGRADARAPALVPA
jgi:hypothetical protein